MLQGCFHIVCCFPPRVCFSSCVRPHVRVITLFPLHVLPICAQHRSIVCRMVPLHTDGRSVPFKRAVHVCVAAGEAVQMQRVQQGLQPEARAGRAHADPHGRETFPVRRKYLATLRPLQTRVARVGWQPGRSPGVGRRRGQPTKRQIVEGLISREH